jgi:ADP-heptose:LPS heptosyltransferase
MNFRQAAFLDGFIGKFLIRVISLYPICPGKIKTGIEYKKILIIKFWGMGSILEATPLLRGLKKEYKLAQIDIITFESNIEVASNLGLFNHVFCLHFAKGFISVMKEIINFIFRYHRSYSLIIDLEFFSNFSAILTLLTSSEYSLGFESFYRLRNRCYSRTIIFDHSTHVRRIFIKFLDALGIKEPSDIKLSPLTYPPSVRDSVMRKIPSLGKKGMHIAVNINTSEMCINRRWPLDHFNTLISLLIQAYSPNIYLIGSKSEEELVNIFYKRLVKRNNVYMIAGMIDLPEFIYFLSNMKMLITSDSGPMHIAEALDVPVVSFFGPETPNLYGPLSLQSIAFYANLFCSPCLNTYNHKRTNCSNNICMQSITAEEVFNKIKAMFIR